VDADLELRDLTITEFPRLVGMLALYVGNRQTAEDLAQETMIRLHQHWPRVRVMDSPSAWMRRVALNLASSTLRRAYAERRANARLDARRPVVPTEAADVIAIRDAVAALPKRVRAVIVLRFYVGLPVADVARELRCPEGTVKSLTSRGIAELRLSIGTDDLERPSSHV
jgi:RNA polymerase sigma-70 factor (ECF subfamily)